MGPVLAKTNPTSEVGNAASYTPSIRDDPDLATLLVRWPELSEAMKMHILAITAPGFDIDSY